MANEIRIPELSSGGIRRMVADINRTISGLEKQIKDLRTQLEALRKE